MRVTDLSLFPKCWIYYLVYQMRAKHVEVPCRRVAYNKLGGVVDCLSECFWGERSYGLYYLNAKP